MEPYLMFVRPQASATSRPLVIHALLMLLLAFCTTPCGAILFYDTGAAGHNTTAPTGAFENSGWQYEGKYGAFLGTMIAPQYFITAQHFGTQGSTFVQSGIFNGGADVTYNIDFTANGGLGYWDVNGANTDLRIFKIQEVFPTYAPLYTGGSETGLTLVTHGMGGPRGDPVTVSGITHGYEATFSDGTPRWGSNTVGLIQNSALGYLLSATFSANGTAEEASLSGGDSGGGLFVNDGGIWKLAGVNYSVDGRFDINNITGDGSDFDAALFDRGGLYEGSDAFGWTFIPNTVDDDPSSFYASRISTNVGFITAITAVPEPRSAILVLLSTLLTTLPRRRSSLPLALAKPD